MFRGLDHQVWGTICDILGLDSSCPLQQSWRYGFRFADMRVDNSYCVPCDCLASRCTCGFRIPERFWNKRATQPQPTVCGPSRRLENLYARDFFTARRNAIAIYLVAVFKFVCHKMAEDKILANHLRGFARRWMHPLLYHSSGNHRGHSKL